MIVGKKTNGVEGRGVKAQGGNLDSSQTPLVVSENIYKIQFFIIIFSIDICKTNMVLVIAFDFSPI